jgi:hypothetical protein
MGFSFADEHIRELTLRVANTNPTSIIYIFVYDKDDSEIYKELENDAKNSNICLLTAKKYDFEEINKFFAGQLNKECQIPRDNTEISQQKICSSAKENPITNKTLFSFSNSLLYILNKS